ncbi:FixH family protein [Eisenibacter elegans]|jgi:hypothetical protein|uniref:FixH family protein n=1 Tax=Eisenibacter elegans TaxID=997 RepID=UPI0003FCDEE2|nr:FixH family protein [Eisenibacter elegans]
MNWGYKIALLYSSFVILILTMVFMSFKHEVNLVAPDYYRQELGFQSEIDKRQNVLNLGKDIEITQEGGYLQLRFPFADVEGEIYLIRPTGARDDLRLPIGTDEHGMQVIPLETLAKGVWRIKIDWQAKETAYLSEQKLELK